MCQFHVPSPSRQHYMAGVSVAKLTCAPTPPNITRVPNHVKYLNIEPHNVQAIVWWLAATLGCSVPKWPLMGVGAWGLQSVFCGKIPIFF